MKTEVLPERRPDAEALAARLRARLDCEVRFDAGSRALYATDSSNYRQVPIGVVVPRTIADVVTAVAVCRELGLVTRRTQPLWRGLALDA